MKTLNPRVELFTTEEKAYKYFAAKGKRYVFYAPAYQSFYVSDDDLRKEWPKLYTLIHISQGETLAETDIIT